MKQYNYELLPQTAKVSYEILDEKESKCFSFLSLLVYIVGLTGILIWLASVITLGVLHYYEAMTYTIIVPPTTLVLIATTLKLLYKTGPVGITAYILFLGMFTAYFYALFETISNLICKNDPNIYLVLTSIIFPAVIVLSIIGIMLYYWVSSYLCEKYPFDICMLHEEKDTSFYEIFTRMCRRILSIITPLWPLAMLVGFLMTNDVWFFVGVFLSVFVLGAAMSVIWSMFFLISKICKELRKITNC